ncbi:cyclin-dependent kinase 11B-like isoform X2 [Rhinatrema bivittatum]|uniref:cyclin-dependent kinase 11B-like isoform X2 n=1 Tax=Rhinatrema bivittatum TaxID=194408 RepID=UPI00112DBCF8|nr:cyclin-dependent kinase 11B-like isoform X2 [Rhinatrema bivittatum]
MLRMGRLPNFSEKDVRLLAKLMKEDERHLYFRPGCVRNQATTDAAWQALRVRFNAQASYPREVEALKKRARRLRREERELFLALRIGRGQPNNTFSSTSEDEAVAMETVAMETKEEAVATETKEEAVAIETKEEEAVATETEEEEVVVVAIETKEEEEEVVATVTKEEVVATVTEEEEAVATETEEEEEEATETEEEEAVATETEEEEEEEAVAEEEEAAVAAEEEEEAAVAAEEEEPEGPPPTQPPPQPHSLPISYPVSRSDEEHEEPSSDAPSAVLDAALAPIGRLDRRVEALEGLLGAHLAELVQGQQQIIQLLSAMAGAGSPLVLSQPPPNRPPPPPQ